MGEQLRKLRSSVLQVYSDATARPIEQVEQDLKMEKYLSAQEALQYGTLRCRVVVGLLLECMITSLVVGQALSTTSWSPTRSTAG